jgi:hypothetical protein
MSLAKNARPFCRHQLAVSYVFSFGSNCSPFSNVFSVNVCLVQLKRIRKIHFQGIIRCQQAWDYPIWERTMQKSLPIAGAGFNRWTVRKSIGSMRTCVRADKKLQAQGDIKHNHTLFRGQSLLLVEIHPLEIRFPRDLHFYLQQSRHINPLPYL